MHLSTIKIYFNILICIKILAKYITIPSLHTFCVCYNTTNILLYASIFSVMQSLHSTPSSLVTILLFNTILAPHYFIKMSFLMPWHICKNQTSHAYSMNSANLIDHLIIYVSNWYYVTLLIMCRTYICQSQKTISNLKVYTGILILFNFVIWIWNLLAKIHLHIFLCTLSILS
jgi:hypothetical protein